ncbi:alpha/beta fold hydrolase [Marinobacter sp.]|uniref:alpha/beta fold hydrolase n=1 Tax=Marinobacter sp. TaxID=50741 RepID=UPI003569B973
MHDLIHDAARSGPSDPPCLILAHGAGAGSDSPFMERLAGTLSRAGVNVWRFEFPYMQKRRSDGRKRPPDRQPVLLSHFAAVIEECRSAMGPGQPLVIGGKSMGGRMASLLAASPGTPDVSGVVCFGYPFHPAGKPDRWRTDHFGDLPCLMAIFQGTRDPFGRPEELEARPDLPGQVSVHWLEGGNHDLRPLKKQGLGEDALIDKAAGGAAAFIGTLK